MSITPDSKDLWRGIGGHFDTITEIICEFIDNSISAIKSSEVRSRNILITANQLEDGRVRVIVEDTGPGIQDLALSLKIGELDQRQTPLNEHGFGLKHALASADPENNNWRLLTRTDDELANGRYRMVQAPYKYDIDIKSKKHGNDPWPGNFNTSGTYVEFICSANMWNTVQKGIPGSAGFETTLDYLADDLGYIYSGVINEGGFSFRIECPFQNYSTDISAVTPEWNPLVRSGEEVRDLGSGEVEIKWEHGSVKPHSDSKKYYQKNMSTSGLEIRINGRVIEQALFSEVWNKEKHNAYNHFLFKMDVRSDDLNKLPKTRTSKNGIRAGDEKLESLFEFVKSILPQPERKHGSKVREDELVKDLKEQKEIHLPDNSTVKQGMQVFSSIEGEVEADLYIFDGSEKIIYEAKRDKADVKTAYQLLMYWDGLVEDNINPSKGIIIASEFSDALDEVLERINSLTDANEENYNFIKKKWKDENVDYPQND